MKAMHVGVVWVTWVLGAGCSKADPTAGFTDYMSKGKASEAELQLTRLGKLLKSNANDNGGLPVTKTGLTPAAGCCAGPDHMCAADAAAWQAPAWASLDFSIDEAHRFQYELESSAAGFTARAVGDLDCDGTTVTYTLRGTFAGGMVTLAPIERPASPD
jgi:hypothetical protein